VHSHAWICLWGILFGEVSRLSHPIPPVAPTPPTPSALATEASEADRATNRIVDDYATATATVVYDQ
jgi:hypothetical protein